MSRGDPNWIWAKVEYLTLKRKRSLVFRNINRLDSFLLKQRRRVKIFNADGILAGSIEKIANNNNYKDWKITYNMDIIGWDTDIFKRLEESGMGQL